MNPNCSHPTKAKGSARKLKERFSPRSINRSQSRTGVWSGMCCSIRAAVFFLASVHIFFAVTQMVHTLPIAIDVIGSKLTEAIMAFIFCISFFLTGFMTFRGADEESATLIRLGSLSLVLVILFRFILMAFSKVLVSTLPEASFLYVYGTPVVPIIFTVILYLVYLALLFCYHNELKHNSTRVNSPVRVFHSPREATGA